VVRTAVVFESDLAIEVAVFVGACAPIESCLAGKWYPAASGAALLVIPLIEIAGVAGTAVEPG
jgi:hypothetical protein